MYSIVNIDAADDAKTGAIAGKIVNNTSYRTSNSYYYSSKHETFGKESIIIQDDKEFNYDPQIEFMNLKEYNYSNDNLNIMLNTFMKGDDSISFSKTNSFNLCVVKYDSKECYYLPYAQSLDQLPGAIEGKAPFCIPEERIEKECSH